MNTVDYDKFWGEIAELVNKDYSGKLPHEKTETELKNEWGISRAKAHKIIQALVESGKLKGREIISGNGKPAVVYSPVVEGK